MNIIYYSEVNLVCIVILVIFQRYLLHNFSQLATEGRIFSLLIWSTILLCVSDLVAGICRGQFFPGANTVIQISNIVFFEASALISYLWALYTFIKLKIMRYTRKNLLLITIPMTAFSIVAILNPITELLFRIDESNRYVRGPGIYLHWITTWLYLISATVHVARKIAREKNVQKRKEMIPFLQFIIAPAIAFLIQMFCYGVTIAQVGITISIVVVALFVQQGRVSTDELTGLNNRHALSQYLDGSLLHHHGEELFALMLDLDNFKKINDKFGHYVGDCALADMAEVLKTSCGKALIRSFICRYGGDEFLILCTNCNLEDAIRLKALIDQELAAKNQREKRAYLLSASIGIASKICESSDDVEQLLRASDTDMYRQKRSVRT